MPQYLTQAGFARHCGYAKSYVTALKQAGRLVMEGGKVNLEASLLKIEQTKDPGRDDLIQKHFNARQGQAGGDVELLDSYQSSRATKEKYLALQAKADYESSIGKLVEMADVRRGGAEIGIALRTSMENLEDKLPAELAPVTDPAAIHAILVEHHESVLQALSNQLSAAGMESE